MITIRYSLTPEDYAELERERRGGIRKRIARVGFGSFAGFCGVFTIWQIFVLPWKNHPFGTVLIVFSGLVCIWGGLEFPGMMTLLRLFYDPYAKHELQIDDAHIVEIRDGKPVQFRWRPSRGLKENDRFHFLQAYPENDRSFFLQTYRDKTKFTIPKRSLTCDQEAMLRDLVLRSSAGC